MALSLNDEESGCFTAYKFLLHHFWIYCEGNCSASTEAKAIYSEKTHLYNHWECGFIPVPGWLNLVWKGEGEMDVGKIS